jgi:hypothetical protein
LDFLKGFLKWFRGWINMNRKNFLLLLTFTAFIDFIFWQKEKQEEQKQAQLRRDIQNRLDDVLKM